jgi:hypothetical protein
VNGRSMLGGSGQYRQRWRPLIRQIQIPRTKALTAGAYGCSRFRTQALRRMAEHQLDRHQVHESGWSRLKPPSFPATLSGSRRRW